MKEWFVMLRPGCDLSIVCSVDPERDSLLGWFYSRIECSSIQTVRIAPDGDISEPLIMVIDDEGLLKDSELNVNASQLFIQSGGRSVIVGIALIGQVVIRGDEPDIGGFASSEDAKMIADMIMRRI